MEDWCEKYRPKSLSEIIGNQSAVEALRKWATEWEHGIPKKRAVILYGPPGVGKTSAAHALANDMGWEIVELNASDFRNQKAIEKIVFPASITMSFGSRRRVILLDEADNFHGTYDRGGVSAVMKVIKKTLQPIILTCNDFYAIPKELRDLCLPIQFKHLSWNSIVKILQRICREERIRCSPSALEKIARNSGGDVRAAINDLQSSVMEGVLDSDNVTVGLRDRERNVFEVVRRVLKEMDGRVMEMVFTLDESPEDLIHWIEENVWREYSGEELLRAYEMLSKADVYLGRVRKRQQYGLWRYATFFMTRGVQHAKKERKGGFTKYGAPTRWLSMYRTKSHREIRERIAEKIGEKLHISKKKAISEMLPYLILSCSDEKFMKELAEFLELEDEEIRYLKIHEKLL
ncbi:MAG: replication factor large subunit [Archaeoglobi archaeon]|nr:replication factor large subunit [Archaeoglobi archaeon]